KADIKELQTEMKEVKEDIRVMKEDIRELQTEMKEVKADIKELQTEMKEVKEDIQGMKVDIQDTKDDVQELKVEAGDLRSSVKSIETTLENEIVHGIKIIAEAHFDLHRKLHEALKITNEEELIALRVTNLEKEMRQVKEQIDKIA
ncbi:coiled-coil domain-containing protein, partial [Frisingicoccus sp.]|uniref:coiled-coil domain-containing protein n=1 Tax=Frisingicoccus sp. TaxID=1918627 RepID=UPI0039939833